MLIITLSILTAFLILSVSANFFLLYRLRKKPVKPPSMELREFIHDLTAGGAVTAFSPSGEVKRIDTSDFLMRSPKQK